MSDTLTYKKKATVKKYLVPASARSVHSVYVRLEMVAIRHYLRLLIDTITSFHHDAATASPSYSLPSVPEYKTGSWGIIVSRDRRTSSPTCMHIYVTELMCTAREKQATSSKRAMQAEIQDRQCMRESDLSTVDMSTPSNEMRPLASSAMRNSASVKLDLPAPVRPTTPTYRYRNSTSKRYSYSILALIEPNSYSEGQ